MRIIEQFIQAKTSRAELCEDGIAVNDYFAAVIDGATSKSAFSYESKTSGRIAMELISEAILKLDQKTDAVGAIREINSHIRKWYKERGILERMREKSEERCTAALAIYSDYRKEIWFVADCQALLNGRLIRDEKNVDKIFCEMRALLIHAELAGGKTEADLLTRDTSRELLMELLRMQTKLQNCAHKSEFCYNAIDGFEWEGFEWEGFEWEGFGLEENGGLRIIKIPESPPAIPPACSGEIVLASDGYPELLHSLAETEACLEKILREDPLCYKLFRSTKGCYAGNLSFDDRCYIRFVY